MLRAALAATLLGLALAIGLPALHLSHAGTSALIGHWWPVVALTAGVQGIRSGQRSVWAWLLTIVGVLWLFARLLQTPLFAVAVAIALGFIGLRIAGLGTGWGLQRHPSGPDLRVPGGFRPGGRDWRVEGGHVFQPVGILEFDLSDTPLPEGTTSRRFELLAGLIELKVPADVGIRARAHAGVGVIELLGHESLGVGPRLTVESDDFETAPRRLDLEISVGAGLVELQRRS